MSAYGQRAAEASAYMAAARQNADDNSEAASADFDAAAKKTASDADSSFDSKWNSVEIYGGGEAGSIAALHGVYKGGKLAYQAIKKRMGTSSDTAKAGDAAGDAAGDVAEDAGGKLQSVAFDSSTRSDIDEVVNRITANQARRAAAKAGGTPADSAAPPDPAAPAAAPDPAGAGAGDANASYADSFDFSGGLDSIGAENIAPVTSDIMSGVADAGSGLLESLGGAEMVGAAIPFVGEGLAIVIGGVVAAVDGLIHIFKHKTTAPKTAPPPAVNAVLAPQPLTAKLSAGLPSQDGSVDLPAQAQSF